MQRCKEILMNNIIKDREKYKKDFDYEFLNYLTNRFEKYWVFEEYEYCGNNF